jgi:membrane-associated protein
VGRPTSTRPRPPPSRPRRRRSLIDWLKDAIDVVLHLDAHLDGWLATYGHWLYGILFAIIFCETGLVVTPFLPGDSLLFAVGALAAREDSPLHVGVLIALLTGAAIIGNTVNYAIGRRVGPAVLTREKSRLFNKKHLVRAHDFYERHGGLTIVLTRFLPIVRTFAPFIAGVARMDYRRFTLFNVAGGVLWVCSFTLGGYWFGNLPSVKRNFHIVVLAIIVLSVLPAIIIWWRERAAVKRAGEPGR